MSKKLLKNFRGLKINPTRYAHLVEDGRPAVGPKKKRVLSDGKTIFGRDVAGVPARPFAKPTAAAISQTAPGEIATDMRTGITREAAKYAAKGKSIYGTPGT